MTDRFYIPHIQTIKRVFLIDSRLNLFGLNKYLGPDVVNLAHIKHLKYGLV